MRIFVINLDKDVERMQFANSQANKKGYKIERAVGILGSNLTPKDLRRDVNKFKFMLHMGRAPMLGEIGCALSHQQIYRRMVNENIPVACIMEDDIIVLDGFKEQLDKLQAWIKPHKPQVMRLNFGPQKYTEGPPAINVNEGSAAACSYCITLAGAKVLLKENYPINTVADSWYRWERLGLIELYNSNPKVCWHNNAASGFTSVIVREDNNKINWNSIPRRISRKILKGIGAIVDVLF